MMTEDYVSFETAKLLKEKGFDVWGDGSYDSGIEIYKEYSPSGSLTSCATSKPHPKGYPAPTLQMVMKWLREEKKLNCIIDVSFNQDRNGETEYYFCVWENKSPYELLKESPTFSIYEEAAEAGIKYCLENLI